MHRDSHGSLKNLMVGDIIKIQDIKMNGLYAVNRIYLM